MVKSPYEPSGPLGWSLSRFLRNISTPPLDGMLVHGWITPSTDYITGVLPDYEAIARLPACFEVRVP